MGEGDVPCPHPIQFFIFVSLHPTGIADPKTKRGWLIIQPAPFSGNLTGSRTAGSTSCIPTASHRKNHP